jgi:hypothetical protein
MKIDFPSEPKALHFHYDDNDSLYVNMFREDFTSFLMPYNGIGKRYQNIKAYFEGSDDEIKLASSIFSSIIKNEHYGNQSELISEVINSIATSLSWQGNAVYELLYKKNKIHILEFSAKNLINCFFWQIQLNIQFEDHKIFNVLDAKSIWRIDMPKGLGGKRVYRHIMKNLMTYDSHGPSFFLNDIETQTNNGFDFTKYQYEFHVFLRKSIGNFGWNLRNLDDTYKTEFHMFYSILTFQWAQSVLRNHIISELNTLFHRLELNIKVIVEGFPTSEEILQFRQQLILGDKTFDEVNQFSYH